MGIMTKLSKNFSLEEFYVSESYPKLAEKIKRTKLDMQKAHQMAQTLLQPIRDQFQTPIKINSGKRSKILNLVIGGVPSSEHRWIGFACACDWEFVNPNEYKLLMKAFDWAGNNLKHNFGQMIIYLDKNKVPEFIHISLVTQKHKGQMLVKFQEDYFLYENWKNRK